MARILLVDDELQLAQIYAQILRERGHEVTLAHSGKDALDKVPNLTLDFILMDIQMPVMDGIEATRQLKSSELAEIPIFALTNLQLPEEVSAALDAGCDGYLAKPSDPEVLADEIALILKGE